jgi:hypothetical protein
MLNKNSKINAALIFATAIFLLLGDYSFASEIDGTISTNPSYAFGENLGWINFGCDTCDVHVTDTELTGFVWSKQYGWINLSPDNGGVTNNCLGELGGRAWSKSLGWLDFSGAEINASGTFDGVAGTPSTLGGRINFGCTGCEISTDWRQCSLRESPAQVIINSVSGNTPTAIANLTITNEGLTATEYQYEWCVVSDINNSCGGGDDVYHGTGAKLINPGEDWNTNLTATVSSAGSYYFKVVVYYGVNSSGSSRSFTITNPTSGGGGSSGGGGGGGGSSQTTPSSCIGADFNKDQKVNSIDFSILLAFWKTNPPFKNTCVDINKDKQVNSTDFSILLSQWGTKGKVL